MKQGQQNQTINGTASVNSRLTTTKDGKDQTNAVDYVEEEAPLLGENRNDGSKENDNSWIITTISLSFCMMIQSYLLVGVFPYSGFLAMHLIDGVDEETAGKYAGLVASFFMVGRTLTSYAWGKVADKYGRVFVIKTSLVLSAIFSVLFGFAPTFSVALAARFLLGLSNGLIGPIRTLVSEVTHGDSKLETKMFAIVMGTWGYGFLINPAITGYLSDPLKQYQSFDFGPFFEPLLRDFPFVLPNLMACVWCVIGFTMVTIFVPETLQEAKREDFSATFCKKFTKQQQSAPPISTQAVPRSGSHSSPNGRTDEEEEMASTLNSNDHEDDNEPATIQSLWARPSTRQHLLVYWFYSFLVISVDELFPLSCISKDSGLGIQEHRIGSLLSTTGLFYVIIQFVVLTNLVNHFGFYKAMGVGALFSNPVVCLIPLSLWTNQDAPNGQLTWSTVIFVSMVYSTIRVFSSVVFSTLTMTTNRTVPNHHRGTMNGLSMMGGSIAKACGPAFAGIFFSSSVASFSPPLGAWVVYSTVALLGLALFVLVVLLGDSAAQQSDSNIDVKKSSASK